MSNLKTRVVTVLLLVTAVLFVAAAGEVFDLYPSSELENGSIRFLHLQGADCAVVKCDDKIILINAGSGIDGGAAVEKALRTIGVTQIDALILQSGSSSHLGGTLRILDNFPVKTLVCHADLFSDNSIAANTALAIAKEKQTAVKYVKSGDSLNFGDALFEFAWFFDNVPPENRSFTLSLKMYGKSFLFAGNGLSVNEREMLDSVSLSRHDVYVAANNGSGYCNYTDLLDAVKPQICVVSCGNGEDKTPAPHKTFLKRIEDRSIRLYTTENNGDIVFLCESDKIKTQK